MSMFMPDGKPRVIKPVEILPQWGLGISYVVETPDTPFFMNEIVKHRGEIKRITAATYHGQDASKAQQLLMLSKKPMENVPMITDGGTFE